MTPNLLVGGSMRHLALVSFVFCGFFMHTIGNLSVSLFVTSVN